MYSEQIYTDKNYRVHKTEIRIEETPRSWKNKQNKKILRCFITNDNNTSTYNAPLSEDSKHNQHAHLCKISHWKQCIMGRTQYLILSHPVKHEHTWLELFIYIPIIHSLGNPSLPHIEERREGDDVYAHIAS